jgi:hypothetical protein
VANIGTQSSFSTTVDFDTTLEEIVNAQPSQGSGCNIQEGATSALCNLGEIPVDGTAEVDIEVVAPNEGGQYDSFAEAFSVEQGDLDSGDNVAAEATDVEGEGGEGGSDSGVIDPGENLSTVTGTNAQPVTAQDPFAIGLTNVSNQSFVGFIEEEPCDGSQEGPLCGTPRVGGVAGNFVFTPVGTERTRPRTGAPAVVIAKLFYDKTIVQGVNGFKILYQKNPSSPVLQLPRCRTTLRSQCFVTKKRASGDQIVRVKLSSDPRVTRG